MIAPGLRVLFVGINPGLYSGAVGHHFAHPTSRFWRALYESGFTPWRLSPFEEVRLLELGLGITNLVDRATASAKDLSPAELREGGRLLEVKVARQRPLWVAVLGVGAYRAAFERPQAQVGPQRDSVASARVWVLPGPSGQNAHYPIQAATREFRRLRDAVDEAAAHR